MSLQFIGAFESTYMPQHDLDVVETSGHAERWKSDLQLLKECGVTRVRYPIRWHRVEAVEGKYDWAETKEIVEYLRNEGFDPIFDLLHHTSYPKWMQGGFGDRRFGDAYLKFCESFARVCPETSAYTLLNEPFTTLFLCGHESVWPPYLEGTEGFVLLAKNVLPALFEASRMYRDILPDAQHVYVEPCEGSSAAVEAAHDTAALANDRRFFVIDLMLNHQIDVDRPFFRKVVEAGGEDLLELAPGNMDVLGLDYYAHMEWFYGEDGVGTCPSPQPQGLYALVMQYWKRYQMPMILGETNIRGFATDRASWLKYTLEQCEVAVADGADLSGYCWFPFIDSLDWDTLLREANRNVDPVGVYWLDEQLNRHPSAMSVAYRLAASGAPSTSLPAYRFLPPTDTWLAGLLPQMAHWEWEQPVIHLDFDNESSEEAKA